MYEENLGCIGPCHVVDVSIKRKERALSVCRFRLMAFLDRNTSGGVVQEHKQSIISRVQIEMLELLYASRGKSSVLSANRVNYKAASSKAKGDIFIFQERKNQLQLLFFSGLGVGLERRELEIRDIVACIYLFFGSSWERKTISLKLCARESPTRHLILHAAFCFLFLFIVVDGFFILFHVPPFPSGFKCQTIAV